MFSYEFQFFMTSCENQEYENKMKINEENKNNCFTHLKGVNGNYLLTLLAFIHSSAFLLLFLVLVFPPPILTVAGTKKHQAVFLLLLLGK